MKIWCYTVTRNEAKLMPFWLRHYEQFCDRITVFDDQSTDGTQEIVKARAEMAKAENRNQQIVLVPYPCAGGLDDRQLIDFAQTAYKAARGQADWVIWVDSDEFLYQRDAGPHLVKTLERLMKEGVQVPLTRGFQMISESFPEFEETSPVPLGGSPSGTGGSPVLPRVGRQITELINEGVEDPVYAKPCVFRPDVEMRWDPGKHYVHGNFNRGKDAGLKLLHYRCLGLDYLRERHARNFARCSEQNKAAGLGVGVYPGHAGHMSEPWFRAILPARRPVLNTSTFYELLRVIHDGVSPYGKNGKNGKNGTEETQGTEGAVFQPTWGSEHPWLHETMQRVQPQVLIEVGSFLGRSAAHMAGKLKADGRDSAIICVDTWLGDDEHWTIPEVRALMGMERGRPCLYEKFLENMRRLGLQEFVVPLPIDSISGARLLSKLGIKADLIYIDGGHVEGEVYRDIANFWTLLRPGGAMLLDDWNDGRFAGLQRDGERFARERGIKLEAQGNKARLWK